MYSYASLQKPAGETHPLPPARHEEGAPFSYDPSRELPDALRNRPVQPSGPPPPNPYASLGSSSAPPSSPYVSAASAVGAAAAGAPSVHFFNSSPSPQPARPPYVAAPAYPTQYPSVYQGSPTHYVPVPAQSAPVMSPVPMPLHHPPQPQYVEPPRQPYQQQYSPVVATPPLSRPPASPAPSRLPPGSPSLGRASPAAPSLGCTLLSRPQADGPGSSRGKHSFAPVTSLSHMTCGFCRRPRTSSKAFLCTACGMSVHKRCAALVNTACTGTLKMSNGPVAFVPSQEKFRGLRVVDFTKEHMWLQGSLSKLSSHGTGWNRRFFALPEGDSTLFYFQTQPTGADAVPSGGFPLANATVSPEYGNTTCPFAFWYRHETFDKPILLGCSSLPELELWVGTLQQTITNATAAAAQVAIMTFSPADNDWSTVQPETVSALAETNPALIMSNAERPKLFRNVMAFDGDKCVDKKLLIKVEGVFDVAVQPTCEYYVTVRLYYAAHHAAAEISTPLTANPAWPDKWLLLCESLSLLPPETVMMISLYQVSKESAKKQTGLLDTLRNAFKTRSEGMTVCLGHCHIPLTSYGQLRTGVLEYFLWPDEGSPMHFSLGLPLSERPLYDDKVDAPVPASSSGKRMYVRITVPEAPFPIVYCSYPQPPLHVMAIQRREERNPMEAMSGVAMPDPLTRANAAQHRQAWEARDQMGLDQLPLIVSGCDFTDPRERSIEISQTVERIFSRPGVPLAGVLGLLSGEVSSTVVRSAAARYLGEHMADAPLVALVPVLLCAVRFEPFDWSTLAEMLIVRALKEPRLAHALFWGCVGQGDPTLPQAARFQFLRRVLQAALSPRDSAILVREAQIVRQLSDVACSERRKTELATLLSPFAEFGQSVRLPLSASWAVTGINVEKCKVLSSNASPIWAQFVGVDVSPKVLIKYGDDLRQDEFAVLYARLLNAIWGRNARIKSRVVSYNVSSVANRLGLIEIVENSKSVGSIQGSVSGALKRDVVSQYLRSMTSASNSWEDVVENFSATLSGACVFEYLLGLGDRHGDNIMLRSNGELFHIDFAYMMGNKTYFGGIPRESGPFTLTPAFADVLGGRESPRFADFRQRCCEAFLEARKHHVFLSSVCLLAMGLSMPHLRRIENVHHVREALFVDWTPEQASQKFSTLVDVALDTVRQQLNDAAHNLVQKMKK